MNRLHRRGFLKLASAGALALVLPPCAIAESAAGRKPNIIFIMVDDLGYHDLGCFGSKTILTPNIDKLCAEGVKFTDCYGGCTVCAPSRSVLMTGYHKGHTPVRDNRGGIPLFPEDVTIAEVLKKAGYATGGFGKWGLGNQGKDGAAERQGFDVFFGYYNQWHAHSYYTHLFRNSVRVELNGRYTHYAIYDETIKFIKKNKDRPFFCYCPWTVPHGPYQIPEDDPAWALYKDKPWNKDAKVVAAMDSMIDRQVGEIVALLKKLGIDDNTIIFFTSDNGGARRFEGIHNSCGQMRGQKRSMYEGGIRVPMIVRWPGTIKAGTVSNLPWYFPDVMPTLAELADVSKETPKDIDGISIVPTLLGKGPQEEHEYMYWDDTWYHNEGVRMGKWKGVRSNGKFEVNPNVALHRGKWKGMKHESGTVEVYDLSKDRGEKNNLAEKYPDIARKLGELMDKAWVEPRSQEDDGVYTGKEPN
ncbi:MAG: sulfatase-like hydrolase/transferase [Planctomycetes bacterium]|nr:sulfatase-like hydrolase/transferase [Planctomycetota bacterium]